MPETEVSMDFPGSVQASGACFLVWGRGLYVIWICRFHFRYVKSSVFILWQSIYSQCLFAGHYQERDETAWRGCKSTNQIPLDQNSLSLINSHDARACIVITLPFVFTWRIGGLICGRKQSSGNWILFLCSNSICFVESMQPLVTWMKTINSFYNSFTFYQNVYK